jgi:hypothetical protein
MINPTPYGLMVDSNARPIIRCGTNEPEVLFSKCHYWNNQKLIWSKPLYSPKNLMNRLNTKSVTLLLIVSILVSGVLSPLMAAVANFGNNDDDQTVIHHSQGTHTHCRSDLPPLPETSCSKGGLCIDCCVYVQAKTVQVTGSLKPSVEPVKTTLPFTLAQQFEVELPPPIYPAVV